MTAPIRITPEYELYRVVTDYEALQDGFADRIEDLNTPLTEIDVAAGLTRGHMQRLINADPEAWRPRGKRRQSREFGWKTLEAALKGTGMALVLVVDDERFAAIKKQLSARRKVSRSIVRNPRPRWLFTSEKASKTSANRWSSVPPEMRKKIMKKVLKARHRKRRKAKEGSNGIQKAAQTCPVAVHPQDGQESRA
jgi:hypothetical protein